MSTAPRQDMKGHDDAFERLRQDVASLDRQIIQALAQRMQLSESAVQFKTSRSDITDASLRQNVRDRAKAWAIESGLSADLVHDVFSVILEHSVARQLALFEAGRQASD